jgi:hypothetical protein
VLGDVVRIRKLRDPFGRDEARDLDPLDSGADERVD